MKLLNFFAKLLNLKKFIMIFKIKISFGSL